MTRPKGERPSVDPYPPEVRKAAIEQWEKWYGEYPDAIQRVSDKYGVSVPTLHNWITKYRKDIFKEQVSRVWSHGFPDMEIMKKIAWIEFLRLLHGGDWQAIMAVLTGKVTPEKPPGKGKTTKAEPVSREAEEAAEAFGE